MGLPPDAPSQSASVHQPQALAQATAKAVMLSTRRTVAAGVRMCAVAAVPISTGPTVTPPLVVVLSTLYKMLAASRLGHTSRLA